MRFYLILLSIIFVLSLFQGVFLLPNLVLLLVLLMAVTRTLKQVVWLAFWSGLLLDLAKGNALGFSGLLFLIFSLILFFYRRRFDASHPFFLSGFVFLAATAYNRILFLDWQWQQALILALLAFLLRPLALYFQASKGGARLKL